MEHDVSSRERKIFDKIQILELVMIKPATYFNLQLYISSTFVENQTALTRK